MIVTPTVVQDLYLIENVYNETILDQFLLEDRTQFQTKKLSGQTHWIRETVDTFLPGSVWNKLLESVDQGELAKLGLVVNSSALWLDGVGFNTGIHEDNNRVLASMQVYLANSKFDLGTKFYTNKTCLAVNVPYRKNCGYLMINRGQLHGFPVPAQETRISTYSWLSPIC